MVTLDTIEVNISEENKRNDSLLMKIFINVLVFFLVFGIKISFIPIGLNKLSLVFLFATYLITTSQNRYFPISKNFIPIVICFLFIGIYSVLVTIFHNQFDFGLISRVIYIIHEPILAGYLLTYLFFYVLKWDIYDLIQILFNVGLIQGVLTVIGYFNENIRIMYDNILPAVSNIKLENLVQRTRGFTNLGGAWLSSLFTISFLCGLYKLEQGKNRLFYLLSMLVMVLGMIFTGRTGLVISIVYMLFYFGRWMYINVAKKTIGYISVSILVGCILAYFLIPDNITLINEATLDWAFEMFMGDNIGETRSGNHLMTMLYIPEPFSNFLWGSGQYFAGTLMNPRTDSGFMKSLLSIGLFGSIIFYGLYLFIFFKTIVNVNRFDKSVGFLIFCILTSTLLIEIKEPYLSTLGYTFIIFVLYFMSEIIFDKRQSMKK